MRKITVQFEKNCCTLFSDDLLIKCYRHFKCQYIIIHNQVYGIIRRNFQQIYFCMKMKSHTRLQVGLYPSLCIFIFMYQLFIFMYLPMYLFRYIKIKSSHAKVSILDRYLLQNLEKNHHNFEIKNCRNSPQLYFDTFCFMKQVINNHQRVIFF